MKILRIISLKALDREPVLVADRARFERWLAAPTTITDNFQSIVVPDNTNEALNRCRDDLLEDVRSYLFNWRFAPGNVEVELSVQQTEDGGRFWHVGYSGTTSRWRVSPEIEHRGGSWPT